MRSKYAPGPWMVGYEALDVQAPCLLGRKDTFKVCDIRGWGYLTGCGMGAIGLPPENAKAIQVANANLIAAAPYMLAALHSAEEAFQALGCGKDARGRAIVRDAIRQAEGAAIMDEERGDLPE